MPDKLPRVTGTELLRALRRAGWMELRRRGSHVILGHQSGSGRLVIPVHPGKTMKVGTLSGILEDAGLSGDDLKELL